MMLFDHLQQLGPARASSILGKGPETSSRYQVVFGPTHPATCNLQERPGPCLTNTVLEQSRSKLAELIEHSHSHNAIWFMPHHFDCWQFVSGFVSIVQFPVFVPATRALRGDVEIHDVKSGWVRISWIPERQLHSSTRVPDLHATSFHVTDAFCVQFRKRKKEKEKIIRGLACVDAKVMEQFVSFSPEISDWHARHQEQELLCSDRVRVNLGGLKQNKTSPLFFLNFQAQTTQTKSWQTKQWKPNPNIITTDKSQRFQTQ